ncbi:hypothetical protein AVEN_261474-1 [Araneus ventricosus]|uniref:Mos1 transposase HTH domain-containing protein n=1 Tax=Araneus ventricosus TaxID=182803 RepID=A0A4Y2KNT1_ARAVE|nr:hypothetical protein AVEN_261474-1 [Araneus ventricosus]
MDSSRSVQREVIQFLRAEEGLASQIYRRMKEVFVEQSVEQCTKFRWCQRYEAGLVNIKDFPRPGQMHAVTNSATISTVDELIRQNCRITTRENAVGLLVNKGTVHHIIHKTLGYAKVCTQWPKHLSENQKTARWELDPSATQERLH